MGIDYDCITQSHSPIFTIYDNVIVCIVFFVVGLVKIC